MSTQLEIAKTPTFTTTDAQGEVTEKGRRLVRQCVLLASIPSGFPISSRIAGGLAAIPFGIHAALFLIGDAPSPSGPYAIAGYMLMSVAIVGWIVAILRPAVAVRRG